MIALTIKADCLLSGAPYSLMAEFEKRLSMKNPAFEEAEKRGRWTGDLEPILQFFERKKGGIRFHGIQSQNFK